MTSLIPVASVLEFVSLSELVNLPNSVYLQLEKMANEKIQRLKLEEQKLQQESQTAKHTSTLFDTDSFKIIDKSHPAMFDKPISIEDLLK